MVKRIVCLFVFLSCGQCFAFDLSFDAKGQDLSVKLANISYPNEMLAKELKSGLPSTIDILLVLSDSSGEIGVELIQYGIVYDLWDENFSVHTVQGGKETVVSVDSLEELLGQLRSPIVKNAFNVTGSLTRERYWVSAKVTLNAISKERIDRIKSWIERNRMVRSGIGQVGGASGISTSVTKSRGGPTFRKLFDRILEKYMENDESALWRSETEKKRVVIHGS